MTHVKGIELYAMPPNLLLYPLDTIRQVSFPLCKYERLHRQYGVLQFATLIPALSQSSDYFLAPPVASYLAMENATSQQTAVALHYLQAKVPPKLHQPVVGIILGSGLHGLADAVLPDSRFEISYTDIPYFPASTGMCTATETRTCAMC